MSISVKKDDILNYCLDLSKLSDDIKENKMHKKEINIYIDIYRDMLNYYRDGDLITTTSLFNTLKHSGYLVDHIQQGRKTKINDILE